MQVSVAYQYNKTVEYLQKEFPLHEAKELANKLFEFYFHLSPVNRVLSNNAQLDAKTIAQCDNAAQKLLQHEPLQYITGVAYFMDLELDVNPHVLIPRPETEELVSKIILSEKENPSLHILDIGTGSGCIAIALKKHLPHAQVTAIDISEQALEVAKRNAIKNNVDIDFVLHDIFDDKNIPLASFDLVVSNPPYVTEQEKEDMQMNVLAHEPHLALFVPNHHPLKYYEQIIYFCNAKLKHEGHIWFEINENYGEQMKALLKKNNYKNINLFADFREKDRYLYVEKI